VTRGAPRFPPPVADRLQEPNGSAVVHVTPHRRTLRPGPMRWLLMSCEDRDVHASLVIDGAKRLRFTRAGITAKTDVSHLLETASWRLDLTWTPDSVEVRAQAA
jgi:hypothetical protein